jgi:hypothetical protein
MHICLSAVSYLAIGAGSGCESVATACCSSRSRPDTDLELGRRSHANAQWLGAWGRLSRADADVRLSPGDLELLATSAYMLGRDADYVASLDRAHPGHLDAGEVARAVRCAFWIGHNFLFCGDQVNAGGWFARAQRLLGEQDCVERGFLLIPTWLGEMGRGDYEQGVATATDAAAIGERFSDLDLTWLARDEQGRALLNLGRTAEGLRLVDEALIAATSGDLSPIVTGIVYRNTLGFCQDALELAHARKLHPLVAVGLHPIVIQPVSCVDDQADV